MAAGMIKRAQQEADNSSGMVMVALLVLQLLIVPVLGWVGYTLWDIRDRISTTQQATAVLETRALGEHERYERKLDDHEQRLRSLERRSISSLGEYLAEASRIARYLAAPVPLRCGVHADAEQQQAEYQIAWIHWLTGCTHDHQDQGNQIDHQYDGLRQAHGISPLGLRLN